VLRKELRTESNQKRENIFLILTGVLFFVRGVQLQCVYPPLEGPDEYQHIAYLTYIEEEGKIPVLGKALVPKSLYPHLLANPHCDSDVQQTVKVGCLRYDDFYENEAIQKKGGKFLTPDNFQEEETAQTGEPDIPLYEAQHPPLYYVLARPVFAHIRDSLGFREAIYTLRIINIALAMIAMLCLLSPIKGIFEEARAMRLSILAISLSPMFMIYVSRVANDALALVFAGLAVSVLTRMTDQRHLILKAAIAGGLIGIGVLTKMTALCILPAAVVYFWYCASNSRMSFRNAVFCSAAVIGCYLIFTMQYHLQNYRDFGTLFPSQETIGNAAAGKTFFNIAGNIRFSHLKDFFLNTLIRSNLWTSGWSFQWPRNELRVIYFWILVVSALGVVPYIISVIRRTTKRALLHQHIALCGLLVIFSFAAAYGHALNSIARWGVITTLPYYVMISYPAFLICVFACARGYGRKGVPAAATILAMFFLVIEYGSLLGGVVQHWTGATDFRVIFERLASVHPIFPGPYFFFPLAIIVCILTAGLLFLAFRGERQDNERQRTV
jgi:4-amino-4-deoxy-L-arabinose transferase-like glycosyltransferase